jgi:D-aminoacyl-tRNA deacylase
MRVVVQRVKYASVKIGGQLRSTIESGLLVFLGIEIADTIDDADWLSRKISGLRIFDDEEGVMNLDIKQSGGSILIISQFTLHAKTKKGNRPSYIQAAGPDQAIPLYNSFVRKVAEYSGTDVQTGEFGAEMDVELINNGPVTIIIDSRNKE